MRVAWRSLILLCLSPIATSIPIVFDADDLEEQLTLTTRPLIDSEQLQALLSEQSLRTRAEQLFEAAKESIPDVGHPTRAIGTQGHNATLEYIYDQLDLLSDSFTVETQIFVALSGSVNNFSLSGTNGETIVAKPLRMTPPTVETSISAPLTIIEGDGCLNSDYYNVRGKVALVKRGKCSFGEKSEAAGQFGAVAVLLWDPDASDDDLVSAELGTPMPNQVSTLWVTKQWATDIATEGLQLEIGVDSVVIEVPTVNIIAESKSGDHNNVVMAGAHSDSVPKGPGINDNGSGTLALLEIAKQLSQFELTNAVRLAWWSAEEVGLKGSLYYTENLVNSEASKIRLFLDYDMLASPNFVYEVYDSDDSYGNPNGSSKLRDMYIDYLEQHQLPWKTQPFDGRSDYVGFLEIGIPASGIDAGAEELKTVEESKRFGGEANKPYDVCYHQACDDLENVNYEAWLTNSRLVAHSIAVYAESLEGFPPRTPTQYRAQFSDRSRREYSIL